jgi:hypothetical protein
LSDGSGSQPISIGAFRALTIVSTGGPLALVALYVPGIVGNSDHAILVALLAIAAFVPAILVWLGYLRSEVGPGGLYAFVEAAAGRTIARVQAALWITSYFLYLVYTTTYIAYDILPPVFPRLMGYRPLLQVFTALVVIAIALLPIHHSLKLIAGLAAAELLLVVVVVAATLKSDAQFTSSASIGSTTNAAANVSVLFICAGLPIFLGGEVRGGGAAVRRGLWSGWMIAAVVAGVALIPMSHLPPNILASAVPGSAVAKLVGWSGAAGGIGVGVAAAVVGVMLAEYYALTRLIHALGKWEIRRISISLAAVFLVGTALALIQPERIYEDLLKPSLITLWLSQLFVFAWYPRFVRRRHPEWNLTGAIVLGVAGSALMFFGLWSTIQNQLGT